MVVSASAENAKTPLASQEPTWPDLLTQQWGLYERYDLLNPPAEGVAPAALFSKADLTQPVTFTPIIALGPKTITHGGWYRAGPRADQTGSLTAYARPELWSYKHRSPNKEIKQGQFTPVSLESGSVEFDPYYQIFGLWVSNDLWPDGGVFTQPAAVVRMNTRFKDQPHRTAIFTNRDAATGQPIKHSYIIGWDYSGDGQFHDVVTQIDNVKLLPAYRLEREQPEFPDTPDAPQPGPVMRREVTYVFNMPGMKYYARQFDMRQAASDWIEAGDQFLRIRQAQRNRYVSRR
jgi:hypothetical protein